jgi:nucleoside-diphosphate-sugar epimerase
MIKEKILVIGASGQIGVELTLALRKIYGNANVVASDLREENDLLKGTGPYVSMDVMNKEMLHVQVIRQNITQIYLLAAILSATGEKNPILPGVSICRACSMCWILPKKKKYIKYIGQVHSSIWANFTEEELPQQTVIEPITVYGISKYAGEFWCNYYYQRWGVDVRSIRYPGLISYKSAPGGGTTDYAVEIFHEALEEKKYECFWRKILTCQ